MMRLSPSSWLLPLLLLGFLLTSGVGEAQHGSYNAVPSVPYTASGTLLSLTGHAFSVNAGTLTNTRGCVYVLGTGLVCDSIFLTAEADPVAHAGDVTGPVGATVVGNDSHLHGSGTITEADPIAAHNDSDEIITGQWTFTTESLMIAFTGIMQPECVSPGNLCFEETGPMPDHTGNLRAVSLTDKRYWTLPDASGTILVAEADTLSSVAARGGFAGTETIAPAYVQQAKRVSPDDVPGAPNAVDDEFDNSALGVGWTWYGGAAPSSVSESAVVGYLRVYDSGSSIQRCLGQTVSYAGDFDIIVHGTGAYWNILGVFAADGTGAGWMAGVTTGATMAQLWDCSLAAFALNACNNATAYNVTYLRLKRVATELDFYVSTDGMAWTRIRQQTPIATTFTRVGVYFDLNGYGYNYAVQPYAFVDWFRSQ